MSVSLELEHALGFTPNIQGAVFLPAFDRSAVLYSCGRLLIESDLDDCHKQKIFRGHDSIVSCVDVSPSGRLMAAGQQTSTDGYSYFHVWDYESGTVKSRVPTSHKYAVEAVKFSPDDMLVATTGREGSLWIWDTTSGKKIASFQDCINGDEARAIRWGEVSESGTRYQKYTLFVPFSTGVRLFSLCFSIQKLQYELQCTACQVPGGGGRMGGYIRKFLCCSTLGTNLLCGTTSGDLMIFNSENGLYRAALSLNANGVTSIVTVEEQRVAFIGGGDGRLKKVTGNDTNWQLHGEVQLEGAISSMSASSDGTQLLVCTTSGRMYRVLTNDLTYTVASESPLRGVNDLALSPADPSLFVTASEDSFLRLWSLHDYTILSKFQLTRVLPANAASGARAAGAQATGASMLTGGSNDALMTVPTSVAFDTVPGQVVCGWSDGKIRCINMTGKVGVVVWETNGGHKGRVHTVVICPYYFATAGDDSVVRLWSIGKREVVAQMQDHKLRTTSLLIDNTTTTILHSISMDMTHAAYDLERLGVVEGAPRRIASHNVAQCGGFLCATQRKDNEREVIVGTADGRLLFLDLDVAQRPVLEVVETNRLPISSCQCSPCGQFLAVGLGDGSLGVYRLGTALRGNTKLNLCEPLLRTPCHSTTVSKCLWTADSRQVISSSKDGDLIVWNLFSS